MRERLDLLANDFQRGRAAARATVKAAATQMVQEGKMTKEFMEEFFRRMEALDKKRDKGSANGTALA